MTSNPIRQMLGKYFIMGSQDCSNDPVEILQAAAKAGITAFQFREKGQSSLSGEAKLELGKQLREICFHYDIPFFINDDIELVEPLQADGIHIGQDDTPAAAVRWQFPDKLIGLSLSNPNEVARSPLSLIDYAGAGPVFATSSKADAKTAVGTEWITSLRSQFPDMPIVGIGGITSENAVSVLEAGADGVAFISAVSQAINIQQAVKKME